MSNQRLWKKVGPLNLRHFDFHKLVITRFHNRKNTNRKKTKGLWYLSCSQYGYISTNQGNKNENIKIDTNNNN